MKRKRHMAQIRTFDLLEASVHLLRSAPPQALLSYYAGSAPFLLALLFYWSDMSRSPFAERHLVGGALGVALLFIWMKCWQAVFANTLRRHLNGEPATPWSASRVGRLVARQMALQPCGLFLLPVALVVAVPFGWLWAFHQNVVALGARGDDSLRPFAGRAWRQATFDGTGNHVLILALFIFAMFVWLNVAITAFAAPFLLKSIAGIETPFTLSAEAMFNTTFLAVVTGLAYLCVDPLVKTAYVLRCFHGESRLTGEDLRVELRRHAVPAALVVFLFFTTSVHATASFPLRMNLTDRSTNLGGTTPHPLPFSPLRGEGNRLAPLAETESLGQPVNAPFLILGAATATPEAPSAQPSTAMNSSDLDRSIDEVLRKPEYTWRTPRQKLQIDTETKGFKMWERVSEWLKDGLKRFGDWMEKLLNARSKSAPKSFSFFSGRGLAYMLIVLVTAIIGLLLYFIWKIRFKARQGETLADIAAVPPDLADENVTAEQLPEDGWLRLALEMVERGDLRLALRAFYLASLAHLAERNLVTLARFKSNRDYERELLRRSHALPEITQLFSENVADFDRIWYGLHEVTTDLLERFRLNVERIKTC